MSVKYNIAHVVGRLVFDKPARAVSLPEMAGKMEETGRALDKQIAAASDSYANYDCLAHIIGIERWGQRRLRTLLGEPPLMDEYDSYRPSIALFWDDLRTAFNETRAETVQLAHELAAAGVDNTSAVAHNELGILTAVGWLRYLDMHATLEAKKLKQK